MRWGWLDRRFAITARGSTPAREVIAGATSFAAMTYILAANPAVMGDAGLDRGDVVIATILVSVLGSALVGLFADLPLGLAPSMGSNAVFAYVVVGRMGFDWQSGLGIMLAAGVVVLTLSAMGARELALAAIPHDVARALPLVFGIFLMQIALAQVARVPLSAGVAGLLTGGVAVAAWLAWRHRAVALMASIAVTAMGSVWVNGGDGRPLMALPVSFVAWPHWPRHTFCAFDMSGLSAHPLRAALAIAVVALTETVGLVATTGAIVRSARLDGGDGVAFARARPAFVSDAVATIAGAALGTATVSPYIESMAGVRAGGRTGLAALTIASCFLTALVLWPSFAAIPPLATAPALGVLGLTMAWRSLADMSRAGRATRLCGVVMATTMLATGDIFGALATGTIADLVQRARRKPIRSSGIVAALLLVAAWAGAKAG